MTLGKGIEQLYVFVIDVSFGVIATSLYIFFNNFAKKRWQVYVNDAVCGVIFAVVFELLNLRYNDGETRLFVFVGVALGILLAFLCKSTLDKVSNALYNLLINVGEVEDGTRILQQKIVDTVCSRDIATDNIGMYAVDNVDAESIRDGTCVRVAQQNRPVQKGRSRSHRIFGIFRNKRIR